MASAPIGRVAVTIASKMLSDASTSHVAYFVHNQSVHCWKQRPGKKGTRYCVVCSQHQSEFGRCGLKICMQLCKLFTGPPRKRGGLRNQAVTGWGREKFWSSSEKNCTMWSCVVSVKRWSYTEKDWHRTSHRWVLETLVNWTLSHKALG